MEESISKQAKEFFGIAEEGKIVEEQDFEEKEECPVCQELMKSSWSSGGN